MTQVNDNDKRGAQGSSSEAPGKGEPSNLTSAVSSASFYGTDPKTPPALPKRQQQQQQSAVGSSHTTYQPSEDIQGNSVIDQGNNNWDDQQQGSWGANWTLEQDNFNPRLGPATEWGTDTQMIEDSENEYPRIDGRNSMSERRWWDKTYATFLGRGLLPTALVEDFHNGEHSLVSVSVMQPDISSSSASSASASPASKSASSPKSSEKQAQGSHSRSSSSSTSVPFCPPTVTELHEAVPHPHAYYCRKHNGWIILAYRSASRLPPIVDSVSQAEYSLLPDQQRRRETLNCLEDDQPYGVLKNKTHHFHVYRKAVDAAQMTPAYIPRSWERAERYKKSHRRMTIGSQELDSETVALAVGGDAKSKEETLMVTDLKEEEEAHNLLDLYLCCQCSLYVLASDVIPGVVPVKTVDALISEKEANPPPNVSKYDSVLNALETIIMIIENKLWKGNNKSVTISGRVFTSKVGWNPTVQKFFEAIGFKFCTKDETHKDPQLQPPDTSTNTDIGKMNRDRLLRAWVELGAIITDYYRRFSSNLKGRDSQKLWIKTENAREIYQRTLGAHPDQIKRLPAPLLQDERKDIADSWAILGMTPSTFTTELLSFAYLAQLRCDSVHTPEYFEALSKITQALREVGKCPSSLDLFVISESSRGRFTQEEFVNATNTLGFGSHNSLRVEYNEADSEFIKSAWKDAIRRSWQDPNGPSIRHDTNEAFRIVAEMRRDADLINEYENAQRMALTPERAYETLEVPFNVDEDMLITVYNMRIEDQPSSLQRMQEAMRFIAEYTCSDRLQQFLNTGTDPGTVAPYTRADWPRGLNQLGNTCYLNSLLQYFYTIRDLRDAVAPLAVLDEKFTDSDKLKDDDLKNHRVGGRIVSRHEVVRSRKFVSQLANLFHHLENSSSPSVTPTLELAKLALVTSKDEEEDYERGGTDTSNSTDATLVDEPAPIRESSPPQPKSPSEAASSVLGKRPRALSRKKMEHMAEEQGKDKEDYVLVSKPSGSNTPVTATVESEGDVPMADTVTPEPKNALASASKAPALPPRPRTQQSGSDMMFGKQHDVAECMDNCMFQIETALLQFGELAGPDDSNKRSLVKRLFYGKIRQRLSLAPDPNRTKSSLHEREDFFSHLPVNVSEESFDLYDGLSGYFDDVVDYEGTKARMEVTLVELPPILQIQLQRVQFNRDTLQPYKSHAYVKFGESIYMDRFLDDAPAVKKNRTKEIHAELTSCRDRIAQLTQGKHAPYSQNLLDTHEFIKNQNIIDLPEATDELRSLLLGDQVILGNELEDLRSRISVLKAELEELWVDETRAEYELTSVFVHRGTGPSFGHYFIYQRWLPDHGDEWFKYNDSSVTMVDKSEVLADTTGDTANPYLLVFARKGSQVIDTVKRVDAMIEN